MASFDPSYTALKNLRQKIYDSTTTTVTLPLRPENITTDLHPYLDDAIVTLSTSTAYLYDDNAPWAVRVVEVKKGVEKVDTKVDKVDVKLDDVKTTLEGQIDDVKTQMMLLEKRLTGQVDDVRLNLRNHTAIQLNSLRKWLGDPIEPVSALALDRGELKFTVGKGFPTRVKDFWMLVLDPTTLADLARHYSVRDWDQWKRPTSGDIDLTCYTDLDDTVTAHPYKCLRALAMLWGLHYSVLEPPVRPLQQEDLVRHQKRKAETDNGSRRIRAREDQDSDSTESTSTFSPFIESTLSHDIDSQQPPQDINDQRSSQDVNDQPSQPSRVISVQVRVPTNTERRYRDLMVVPTNRELRRRNARRDPPEDPYAGYVLGWRIDSPSTAERRRNRVHHPDGRSVHTSEIRGHQGRSSRDRSSRDRSSRDRSSRDRSSRDHSSKKGEIIES